MNYQSFYVLSLYIYSDISIKYGIFYNGYLRPPSIIFDGAEAAQAGRVYCHTLVQWLASCLQRDVSVDSRGAYIIISCNIYMQ